MCLRAHWGKGVLYVKIFIINVKECLNLSQYEPFFYEHIYEDTLTILPPITDTCELDGAYEQILDEMNQHPFAFKDCAVFVLIPRNFSSTPAACDFEIYNDINVFTRLAGKLPTTFRFFTFYVDKTGSDGLNDPAYARLQAPSEALQSSEACLAGYCPSFAQPQAESYKLFLKEQIDRLHPCARAFFESVWQALPESKTDTAVQFQNGINYFAGECKKRLSHVKHCYEPIVQNDMADDVESKLKIVYYIKSLTDAAVTADSLPNYAEFPNPDYNHIRRLLSTYISRLSSWLGEKPSFVTKGTYTPMEFISAMSCTEYSADVDRVIAEKLNTISINSHGNADVVGSVFDSLNSIVEDATEKMDIFAEKQSQELFLESNYLVKEDVTFELSEPIQEDEIAEREQLEKLHNHSEAALPDFSTENRLNQRLECIDDQVQHVLAKLKAYRKKSFFLSHTIAFLGVITFYLATQYSAIDQVAAWAFFGVYAAVVYAAFLVAYIIVKKKYAREIDKLLREARRNVHEYLSAFKTLAADFEHNLREAAAYRCLKRKLEQKNAQRLAYQGKINRYNWHKTRVGELLKNVAFFEHFIKGAIPYEEEAVTFDSYDHDVVHTVFYQLKVF